MVHKFSGIVKNQIDYWKYQVANYGPDHPRYRPAKIAKYEHLIKEFGELADFLDRLDQQESVDNPLPAAVPAYVPQPAPPKKPFTIRRERYPVSAMIGEPEPDPDPKDLSDLPPELLKELSESAKGETDNLIKVIQGRGGVATLDEILIDLYRKYKEIGKRPIVSNKLYRLSRRGLCWSVPGKKGTYTTVKPDGASDNLPEDDEGPDAATSEPSNDMGVADLPSGGPNQAPTVGSSPTTSTPFRRKLMSETSIPPARLPFAK